MRLLQSIESCSLNQIATSLLCKLHYEKPLYEDFCLLSALFQIMYLKSVMDYVKNNSYWFILRYEYLKNI